MRMIIQPAYKKCFLFKLINNAWGVRMQELSLQGNRAQDVLMCLDYKGQTCSNSDCLWIFFWWYIPLDHMQNCIGRCLLRLWTNINCDPTSIVYVPLNIKCCDPTFVIQCVVIQLWSTCAQIVIQCQHQHQKRIQFYKLVPSWYLPLWWTLGILRAPPRCDRNHRHKPGVPP